MRRLCLLVVGVLVAGCSNGEPVPTRIVEARVGADGTALGLSVDACNSTTGAEVVAQTPEAVRVRAMARPPGMDRDDCLDGITVCIDEPLGGRAVIDETTGGELPVERTDARELSCPAADG